MQIFCSMQSLSKTTPKRLPLRFFYRMSRLRKARGSLFSCIEITPEQYKRKNQVYSSFWDNLRRLLSPWILLCKLREVGMKVKLRPKEEHRGPCTSYRDRLEARELGEVCTSTASVSWPPVLWPGGRGDWADPPDTGTLSSEEGKACQTRPGDGIEFCVSLAN